MFEILANYRYICIRMKTSHVHISTQQGSTRFSCPYFYTTGFNPFLMSIFLHNGVQPVSHVHISIQHGLFINARDALWIEVESDNY